MDTPVFDFVRDYASSGRARLHMPGHKGRGALGCEALDITEVRGADSLYEAAGIIERSERNAAELFGSRSTFYSTEGSSQCIKAMLCLASRRSESRTVIAARNAHKSFVHALALLDLDVRWLWPEEYSLLGCPVSAAAVASAIDSMAGPPCAVYLTSPDYLGSVQPVAEIAAVCHERGVPLLVDNAHGAYLHFLEKPMHPLDLGADMCCDSAHKTLPVLTGGAYLHISRGFDPGSDGDVRRMMSVFGSTSPSYLIMQSLDICNAYLAGEGRELIAGSVAKAGALKERLAGMGWRVTGGEPLKVTVNCGNALEVSERLREHGAECEYADPDFVVLMLSPQNSGEDISRVLAAFSEFAPGEPGHPPAMRPPERAMGIREALFAQSEELPVRLAAGRVCSAPSVGCPPAVPVAVCGEVIGADAAAVFEYYGNESVCVVRR